jgi:hypothetical protein
VAVVVLSASRATGVSPALPKVTLAFEVGSANGTRCAAGPRVASSSTDTMLAAFVA